MQEEIRNRWAVRMRNEMSGMTGRERELLAYLGGVGSAAVAFSGGVANQGEALLEPLREEVRRQEFGGAYVKRHARLVKCELGYQSGIIGAALLATQN